MPATLTIPTHSEVKPKSPQSAPRLGVVFVTPLTALALAIHGYHPYAEDGGLYMAGVKRLLNPALYPKWSAFVTEHLRFSLFAPLVAALVRISHLQLMNVWLILYVATIWSTLLAAWLIATRCYKSLMARCGAVALLAAWLTLPIAGTALMLMDPYLSARSISTPLTLFAVLFALDAYYPQSRPAADRRRPIVFCFLCLLSAAAVHPLMAAYAIAFISLFACLSSESRLQRTVGSSALAALALTSAAMLCHLAPPETAAYRVVALTRTYWFVGRWQWYEQFGLAAPMAILIAVALHRRSAAEESARALAHSAALASTIALMVAATFAQSSSPNYLVARLQPLRMFQIVYILMILAVGAYLGERVLRRKPAKWVITFASLAAVMVYGERHTFPASTHIELPWNSPANGWQRAFDWVSINTPVDALFALDAHYVTHPGEDAQTFRAIAERSALPDYSKDGGEASITPELTSAWSLGQAAQTGLDTASDASRLATLKPLHVGWVVLSRSAHTSFQCLYTDEVAKVCRLPPA